MDTNTYFMSVLLGEDLTQDLPKGARADMSVMNGND